MENGWPHDIENQDIPEVSILPGVNAYDDSLRLEGRSRSILLIGRPSLQGSDMCRIIKGLLKASSCS